MLSTVRLRFMSQDTRDFVAPLDEQVALGERRTPRRSREPTHPTQEPSQGFSRQNRLCRCGRDGWAGCRLAQRYPASGTGSGRRCRSYCLRPVTASSWRACQCGSSEWGWAGVASGVGGVHARRQLLSRRRRWPMPVPVAGRLGGGGAGERRAARLGAGGCVAVFAPGVEAGGCFWGEPGQASAGVGRRG